MIRVMLVTQNVKFAVSTARSLEKLGDFAVVQFTSAQNATAYLRENPQHVALVDFALTNASAPAVIKALRGIQPDIAVIGAPRHAAVNRIADEMGLQGVVDIPTSLRDLVPLLRSVVRHRDPAPPPAAADVPVAVADDPEPDAPQSTSRPLEFVMSGDGQTVMQITPANESESSETAAQMPTDSLHIFNRLAEEEPPMPPFEASGTVHDLMDRVTGTGGGSQRIQPDADAVDEAPASDDEPGANTAAILLQSAMDDSQPLRFSLDAFVDEVNRRLPDDQPRIQPLPSWVYAPPPEDAPAGASVTVKVPTSVDDEADSESHEVVQSADAPPSEEPASSVSGLSEEDLRLYREEEQAFFRSRALAALEKTGPDMSDPRITEMALVLTQMALETAAEATVLTLENHIVAHAGALDRYDIDAIGDVIDRDWDAEPELSRIRFVTLPSNGADYLLFSRRSQEDFTLTMVFAGTMPLRVIRRQSDRLTQALSGADAEATVPSQSEPADVSEHPVELDDSVVRAPHTFMWLLRDVRLHLSQKTINSLTSVLRRDLAQLQIQIESLDVRPDAVYLYVQVPADMPARPLLAELMASAAQHVAAREPDRVAADLWDASYYVLTPGRELSPDEIQQFIDFARAG